MTVDSSTVWVSIAVCAIVIGGFQVAQYLIQRDEPAMLLWGAAKLIGASGAAFLALRGTIPDFASVTLGNSVIVLAMSVNSAGLSSFSGERIRRSWVFGPAVAAAVGYQLVPGIDADIPAQTLINGVLVVAVLSWAAYRSHRANRVTRYVWQRAMTAMLGLWVLTMLTRMAGSLFHPQATDPTQSNAEQAITGLILMSLVVMTGLSELLASRERVDRRLAEAALRDSQTGTLNRAGLAKHTSALLGSGAGGAVLLMDLDLFKQINDTYGHSAGDAVIESFAEIARDRLPATGVLARYGGEEFCAVLPGTGLDDAAAIAERIRTAFAATAIPHGERVVTGTVSIGVSRLAPGATMLDDATSAADHALYESKTAGRNRVCVAGR